MKVLLINPSKYDEHGVLEKYRKGTLPPLNLVIVATLMQAAGVDVRIVDEYLEDVPFDEPFDLVGMSTTFTCTFPRVVDIGRRFRAKGIPVVLGGTHATCFREAAAEAADSVVLCEAEDKLDELLQDVRGGSLKPFYGGGDFVALDAVPYRSPRYDLLDLGRYIRLGLRAKSNIFMVESSRGCPMGCTFCSIGITHGAKPRFRSIEAVIREIRHLKDRYGSRFFAFADDNFTIDTERCRALLAELRKEDIRFYCELSTTVGKHPGLIEELASAGCVSALIGMESIDPDNLASVHKGFNRPDEYRSLFRLFKQHRISAMAAMIFGFDHDSPDVFANTVDFLKGCAVPRALFTILTPVPGTPLFEQFESEDRIVERNFSLYDGAHAVFAPRRMSPRELENGFWRAYRSFYDLPSIASRTARAGTRSALYTLATNWRFRQAVYHRLYPYNSGIGRLPARETMRPA